MRLIVTLCLIISQVGLYVPVSAGQDNYDSTLAPASDVFLVMLDSVLPTQIRQQLETLQRDFLAEDEFKKTQPGKAQIESFRKKFSKENLQLSEDVELTYNNRTRLGLVAGVIEFKDRHKHNSQPGGILILSNTPLLSKNDNEEYWWLWEKSKIFREYETEKIRNLLDALQIQYHVSSGGTIFYLSPQGIKAWYDFYDDLKKAYDLCLSDKNSIKNVIDRIGPAHIPRTAKYKQCIGSIFIDYCRIYLFNDENPVPIVVYKTIMVLKEDTAGRDVKIVLNHMRIIKGFYGIACPGIPELNVFDSFGYLPSQLNLAFLSLMGDWRILNKRKQLIGDDEQFFLFQDNGIGFVYCLEIYEYIVRNVFGRKPFDRSEGINFYRELKKTIENILRLQLSETNQDLFQKEKRIDKVKEAIDIVDMQAKKLTQTARLTINYKNNLPYVANIYFGKLLLKEIENVEEILQIIADKLNSLEGIVKQLRETTEQLYALLVSKTQESGNLRKVVKALERQTRGLYSQLLGKEKAALTQLFNDCSKSPQDITAVKRLGAELTMLCDKMDTDQIAPLKKQLTDTQRCIAELRIFVTFMCAGIDSAGEKTKQAYMIDLSEKLNTAFACLFFAMLKSYVTHQPEDKSTQDFVVKTLEDYFEKQPEGSNFKTIFDGDCRLFRAFLIFVPEYPDEKKSELLKYLYNTYRGSDLNKPYAALILARYYLYQNANGICKCLNPFSDFSSEVETDYLIHRWLRNAFESLPAAIEERERLLSKHTPLMVGYIPNMSKLLQEIHRLLNFSYSMFYENINIKLYPVLKFQTANPEFFDYESQYLDKIASEMLDEKNPNWEIILSIYTFKTLHSFSEIIDTAAIKKYMLVLVEKEIPDKQLESFLEYLRIDRCLLASIWAEVIMEYIKEHNLEARHTKSIEKIKEILSSRTDYALQCQLPYLAQWYFKCNDTQRAIETLNIIISALRPKESIDEFPNVYVPIKIKDDFMPEYLKKHLVPYIRDLETAREKVVGYVERRAIEWISSSSLTLPDLDCAKAPGIGEIAWQSELEKNAVLELLEKNKFASLYFLEYLIKEGLARAKAIYEIPIPPQNTNAQTYYVQQFTERQKNLQHIQDRLTKVAGHIGVDICAMIEEAKTPQDSMAIKYNMFLKRKNELDYLTNAQACFEAKKYTLAKSHIDRATIPLSFCPKPVNSYVIQLKKYIDNEFAHFEKDRQGINELISKAEAFSAGREMGSFTNIKEDIEFVRVTLSNFPDLLNENPDWDYEKLICTLEEIKETMDAGFARSKELLEKILDQKIVRMQDWILLREELEKLRRLDTKTFAVFFEEATGIFMRCYSVLYPQIKTGLFQREKPHSIMDEDTFVRLNQLAFISRELYGYLEQVDSYGAIKTKIPKLYQVQSASHTAFIMQKIKVARLMLTVLAKAEEKQIEELRGMSAKKYCRYSKRPVVHIGSGTATRAILSLDNLTDFQSIYNPDQKLAKAKKIFRPGNRFVFANNEEMFESPDKYTLPTFEIVEVTKAGIVMDCANFNLFNKPDLATLIQDRIGDGGFFNLQQATDIIIRRDLLDNLWHELDFQKDRLDIGHKKEFHDIRIKKRYNNDPNNLINALLGLSTMYDGQSVPPMEYPDAVIDTVSLNESQRKAVLHVYGSIVKKSNNAVHRVAFIQGPGGCGKTHTLVELCKILLDKCITICLTAPTHVATDNMVKGVLEKIQSLAIPEQIARFGSEEAKIDPEVHEKCYKLRAKLIEDLLACKPKEKGHILAHTIAGRDGDPEIQRIKEELSNIIDEIIAVLEDDLVIVDEAGMTGIDQILVLADRAAKAGGAIAIFGDPKQLPNYGIGPTHQQLIKDVFEIGDEPGATAEFNGINIRDTVFAEWVREIYSTSLLEDRYGRSGAHSFFFNENRRSTDLIAELLNIITYREDGNEMVSKREPIDKPPTEQIKIFDTANTEQEAMLDGRRGQYISVTEADKLLYQMAEDFGNIDDLIGDDVAFISPYKAQLKLFENMLILHCLMNELANAEQSNGEFSAFFSISSTRDIAEITNYIQKAINSLPRDNQQKYFSDRLKDMLKNALTAGDEESRRYNARALQSELYTMYENNYLSSWHYSKRMTLARTKRIDTQSITDEYTEEDTETNGNGIHLSTIHKIQGKEKRVVYISLVRNNPFGRLGFLGQKLGPHMINTAIGRAKECLRIAFNKRTWEITAGKTPMARREYYGYKSAQMVMQAYKYITEELPKIRSYPSRNPQECDVSA